MNESNFSNALSGLRSGKKWSRTGWNGKGMYLYLVPAAAYPASTDIARAEFGDTVPYQAYIAFKTNHSSVVPWVASQTDLLADDWQEVIS